MKRTALCAYILLSLACNNQSPTAAAPQIVLPKPDAPFAGKIGRTAKESTPDFPKRPYQNLPRAAP